MWKSIFLVASLYFSFPCLARAEFPKSDIDDLKAILGQFADGGCRDRAAIPRVTAIVGRLSVPISNRITPAEAARMNRMRDALSGVRSAVMASLMGGDLAKCPEQIRTGIAQLNSLTVDNPLQSPAPAPYPANANEVISPAAAGR